jgi:hypothetical protein
MHRSHRRTICEKALGAVGGTVRRCHNCDSRFVQIGGSLIRVKDAQRVFQKVTLALGMAAAAAVMLGAILWLTRSQPAAVPGCAIPLP